MKLEKDTARKLMVTAGGLAVSVLLTRALAVGWEKVFEEEPPSDNPSDEMNWVKVALWGALMAGVVSTAEFAARRSLSQYLDKHIS